MAASAGALHQSGGSSTRRRLAEALIVAALALSVGFPAAAVILVGDIGSGVVEAQSVSRIAGPDSGPDATGPVPAWGPAVPGEIEVAGVQAAALPLGGDPRVVPAVLLLGLVGAGAYWRVRSR